MPVTRLEGTFQAFSSLTGVTIPDSVTNIGLLSFDRCDHLTRVAIPDSVTTIEYSAFNECLSLPEVTFPASLTTVGVAAFANCDSLTNISIPGSLTNIGEFAFGACHGLIGFTVDDGNSLYTDVDGVLFNHDRTILVQYPAGRAGPYSMPSGTTAIGGTAFDGCGKLTDITVPDSVTSIGHTAFYGCVNLARLTIPNRVTSIGSYAFGACGSLASLTIPSGVTYIGEYTFSWSTNLTNVTFSGNITAIGDGAFSLCTAMVNLIIPGSVTSLGNYVFQECTRLKGVYFLGDQPTVGGSAFEDASDAVVYYARGRTGWGATFGGRPTAVWDVSMPYDYEVVNGTITILKYTGADVAVVIPDTIEGLAVARIKESAFLNLTNLVSVTIPATVTDIGDRAFSGCTGLEGVYFQGGPPTLGAQVFPGDDSATVYYRPEVTGWDTTFGGLPTEPLVPYRYRIDHGTVTITEYTGDSGVVQIPATIAGLPVTSIADSAFDRVQRLTEVTIPDSVTSIGDSAFAECTSLTRITLGNGVRSIGAWAFNYCIQLTSVHLPATVTLIKDFAFFHCPSLAEITVDGQNVNYSSVGGVLFDKGQTKLIQCPGGKSGDFAIPEGVIEIAPYSFEWCTGVTSVTMPDTVTSIGDQAFAICGNLVSITLSRNISTIGSLVFGQCTNLAVVFIPTSVTNIGPQAFDSCPHLKAVYFQGNAPAANSTAFNNSILARVYYLPGTLGWGANLAGRPTGPWVLSYPVMLTSTPNFGIQSNRFGFTVSWATSRTVVVEGTIHLTDTAWLPLSTNTPLNGWFYFSDPQWTNYLSRFYRVRPL
jgi:hypothetical protein